MAPFAIDMQQPVAHQLATALWSRTLTKAAYLHWVHVPHFFAKAPRYPRLFLNPVVEALTIVTWWVVPLFWVPVILFMFAASIPDLSTSTAMAMCVLGLLKWSFLEYVLHRFVFHMDDAMPDHPLALALHFALHGIHHKFPTDPYRLVFPPAVASVLCIIVTSLSYVLWTPLLPLTSHFWCMMAAFIAGYVAYDMCHYSHHLGNIRILAPMQRYHNAHHCSRGKGEKYGVSTPAWDYVFGTRTPTE